MPSTPASEADFTFTVGNIGVISDLDVVLSISYPYVRELSIFLIGPDSTQVNLIYDVEGASIDSDANLRDTRFNDSAAGVIGSPGFNTAPFQGSYKPQSFDAGPGFRLSAFNGKNAQGTWKVAVFTYDLGRGTDHFGTLYKPGESASWGATAIGTSLIITTVPEPRAYALVFGGLLLLVPLLRRIGRTHPSE